MEGTWDFADSPLQQGERVQWLPSPCLSALACTSSQLSGTVMCQGAGRERERSLGTSGAVLSVWQPAVCSDFTSHFHLLPCCRPPCTLILCSGCSCSHVLRTVPPLPSPLTSCQPLHFQAVLSNLTHPEDHPSPPVHLPPAGWPARLVLQQVLWLPRPDCGAMWPLGSSHLGHLVRSGVPQSSLLPLPWWEVSPARAPPPAAMPGRGAGAGGTGGAAEAWWLGGDTVRLPPAAVSWSHLHLRCAWGREECQGWPHQQRCKWMGGGGSTSHLSHCSLC